MTMFKKVFGSQIAASGANHEQAEDVPEQVEDLPMAPRPRSQPILAPVPQGPVLPHLCQNSLQSPRLP